ncbi:hypothetical protein [Streptococcus gordonii]|jgi:hypothetical protein|uniref:Uncharacterized protein n=3 Tax=Streptococcus TaxID=1301 RepID=A0AB35FU92_STRGN|nr:hypothetical protein [Streptococcus gordonii]MBZ2127585.1 hypothetical protein [Streptococcus gordonii]MBZ2129913.1 hypothetical protein [Streptococcus gordonii]
MSFLKNRFVRNKEIVKISLFFLVVSLLPVFYVLVKETIDFDWLSYYGSILGSYLILYTLHIENKKYREEKRDSVRPIFNIGTNYESMESSSEELKYTIICSIYSENRKEKSNPVTKKYTLNQCNYIRILKKVNNKLISQQKENSSNDQNLSKSILIKVRNIGSGHALIDKIKCKDSKGLEREHVLEPHERFMIDKGTSNNLLLQFDSKISDIDHVKIYFIDVLGYEYVYKLKLECKPNRYPKHYIKLKNTKVYLANLSRAYFESYFPKLVGKVKETDY